MRTLASLFRLLGLPAGLALAALASACTTPRVPDPCPETARMRCLTDPVCEVDTVRRCNRCRCSAPLDVPPGRMDPTPGNP